MVSKHSPHGRGSTPLKCRECGVRRDDGHRISKRGLCTDCAVRRQAESCAQISTGEGEFYDEWIAGLAAFVDDATPGAQVGTPAAR